MGGGANGREATVERVPGMRGGLGPLAGLLRRAREIPGIKHVFLGSGLRYDLLRPEDEADFLEILRHHVSGQLKVAPEHVDRRVLELMRKGVGADFPAFIAWFTRLSAASGKKLFLVPYFMTAYPGAVGRDQAIRALVERFRLAHQQLQEFTPTPGTLATAMFHTGLDLDGKPLEVARNADQRKAGRREIQRDDRRDGQSPRGPRRP